MSFCQLQGSFSDSVLYERKVNHFLKKEFTLWQQEIKTFGILIAHLLTLNNEKLIPYFKSLNWTYLNSTYLFIFACIKEQFPIYSLSMFKSVLTLNQDIWDYHGS